MFFRHLFLPLLALTALVLLPACDKNDPKPAAVVPKSIEDRFPIQVGGRTVHVQVAFNPAEMYQGLMYRRTMGADEGMLFVYDQPQLMSFWMRNTELPLDIGFFDATGELREIYPMYPHDERPVVSRGRMQFALETNQGWYRQSGVAPGARLELKALAEAIRARGVRPDQLGLKSDKP